jgi:hypothetical protein
MQMKDYSFLLTPVLLVIVGLLYFGIRSAPNAARRSPPGGNHYPDNDALTAKLLDTTINGEIQRLTKGKIAFESPLEMGLNETKVVEVRVARNFNQELTAGLATSGHAVVEDITVGPFMSAALTGSAFEIKAVTPKNQFIPENHPTAWRWQVHPTDWGKQHLTLQLCARLQLPDKREEPWCSNAVYQRDITVQVAYWYAATHLIKNDATWTLGILGSGASAIGAAAWAWRKRKKNEKKQTVLEA